MKENNKSEILEGNNQKSISNSRQITYNSVFESFEKATGENAESDPYADIKVPKSLL